MYVVSGKEWWYWCQFGNVMDKWTVLVGKPEGKRPMGRPRRRWVDIRMDLQEVRCGYTDWIGLAQDRERWRTIVSAVMNFRVPWNAGNFLTSCKPVSCSRRTLHYGVSKYAVDLVISCCWGNPTVPCLWSLNRCIPLGWSAMVLYSCQKIKWSMWFKLCIHVTFGLI